MKKILPFFILFISCSSLHRNNNSIENEIDIFITNWHLAASNANFDDYFNKMHSESIFIGTDATENWNKNEFQIFAKPFFDKGKAWDFKTLERNIYFSPNKKTAWFDELLETQMKICRGSGVLVFENNQWLIKHYVLSMTIPNDNTKEVISIKEKIENPLIKTLKKEYQKNNFSD